jgi:hypothetical protein
MGLVKLVYEEAERPTTGNLVGAQLAKQRRRLARLGAKS